VDEAHNDSVLAHASGQIEYLKTEGRREIQRSLEHEREVARQEEINRRVLGVFLGMINGFAAGMASTQASTVRGTVHTDEGCLSDFQCSFGMRCMKPAMNLRGTCMKQVNEYGVQQWVGPRTDGGMGLGKGQCDVAHPCSIGFSCENTLCVKH